ncbi:hypothetical protein F5Y05DRAFT_411093 [Hypoxylon sp. FL0543]|nr:hypothetical protein F5Y05DRAFT_411093 [Hypoxylon sp. FL0543]
MAKDTPDDMNSCANDGPPGEPFPSSRAFSLAAGINGDGQPSNFFMRLLSACNGRRFVFGDGGHFGLGPRCIAPDDYAYVLFGANAPFVLRSVVNGDAHRCFHLLGEACVNEVMHGDIVVAKEAERVQPRILKLV